MSEWKRECFGGRVLHGWLPTPSTRHVIIPPSSPPPTPRALWSQAFAAAGQLRSAGKYYKQLRRSGATALAAVAVSHRRMWELLIESNCRQGKVKQALQVGTGVVGCDKVGVLSDRMCKL